MFKKPVCPHCRAIYDYKEINNQRNNEKIKVLVNNTVIKSDNETENFKNGYYVNDGKVYIYIENDLCYAKYIGL